MFQQRNIEGRIAVSNIDPFYTQAGKDLFNLLLICDQLTGETHVAIHEFDWRPDGLCVDAPGKSLHSGLVHAAGNVDLRACLCMLLQAFDNILMALHPQVLFNDPFCDFIELLRCSIPD